MSRTTVRDRVPPEQLCEQLRTAAPTALLSYSPIELDNAAAAALRIAKDATEVRGRIKVSAAGRAPTAAQARDLDAAEATRSEYLALAERLAQAAEHVDERAKAEGADQIARGEVRWSDPNEPWSPAGRTQPMGRVLAPEQRVADWSSSNGPQARPEHDNLSLGAMLRGWVTGRWDDAEREQRALLEGTQAGGGVLVPTPLSTELIDRARNMSRCMQAGARTVPMDSAALKVPRIAGSPAPAWRAENAAIAEGDLTFDSVTFTAKSMALIVRASRELIEDGRDVDNTVLNDLGAQVATELDRVMLRGSGPAPEPRGVRNTSGVTITAFGGANGAAPANYDLLLDAAQVLRGGNYEPTGVIHAPRTATTFARLKNTQGDYLVPPKALDTVPMLTTNQIPQALTVGTSTDTSEIYVGDWSKLWLGLRTQLTFTLAERYADVGQVAFLTWIRADVQLAQPGAFNVITGIRP